jgi:hypothetical protein
MQAQCERHQFDSTDITKTTTTDDTNTKIESLSLVSTMMMASKSRQLCGLTARRLVASRSLSSPAVLLPKRWVSPIQLQQSLAQQRRLLSTTSTTATAATTVDTETPKDGDEKKKKKDDSNVFLDNLGTIFLTAIVCVVLTLVRSTYGTSNRNKLREQLEEEASLDPLEIDDLRVANCELTPQVFRSIMANVAQDFPQGTAKYDEFVFSVRKTMNTLKGDAFTIELGHLMDRVVDAALTTQGKTREDEVSLVFLLTSLSLAMDLDASVSDRIRVLYEALQLGADSNGTVTHNDVAEIVGYLQDTSQLTPEAQVVEGDSKIPTQQFKVATPEQLIGWEGPEGESVDLQAFSDILRSKSVCAWGECYFKKKTPI